MRRWALAIGIATLAASCGYVGDPLPPALNIPQPVQDLRLQQVESKLTVAFTIPPKTTENLPIAELGGVELRVGRNPESGWNQDAWAATAQVVTVEAAKPGPAEAELDVREFAGQEIVAAVRLANKKGRTSAWSNLVTLKIETPVVTPDFTADSHPAGAVVRWTGHAGAVLVYRDDALLGEGTGGEYVDRRAELGKSYKYEIQARGAKAQGKRSRPVSVTVEDRFAPGAPAGLSAIAGAGTVELTWNPNPEPDILGYSVLRAGADGKFAVVAPFVDAPAYTDSKIERGARYRYQVTAIDLRKNQSPTSQEVEITVP